MTSLEDIYTSTRAAVELPNTWEHLETPGDTWKHLETQWGGKSAEENLNLCSERTWSQWYNDNMNTVKTLWKENVPSLPHSDLTWTYLSGLKTALVHSAGEKLQSAFLCDQTVIKKSFMWFCWLLSLFRLKVSSALLIQNTFCQIQRISRSASCPFCVCGEKQSGVRTRPCQQTARTETPTRSHSQVVKYRRFVTSRVCAQDNTASCHKVPYLLSLFTLSTWPLVFTAYTPKSHLESLMVQWFYRAEVKMSLPV